MKTILPARLGRIAGRAKEDYAAENALRALKMLAVDTAAVSGNATPRLMEAEWLCQGGSQAVTFVAGNGTLTFREPFPADCLVCFADIAYNGDIHVRAYSPTATGCSVRRSDGATGAAAVQWFAVGW